MELIFEELDYQETPNGVISLRRRTEPKADNELVYEVKLGEEFLMSSLFVEAEKQLSYLAIDRLLEQDSNSHPTVVVGGLGLGYTAKAALEYQAVTAMKVVDIMAPVIEWHRRGILPLGTEVAADERCELVHADFFELAATPSEYFGFKEPVDAILLDIDHSPSHWLHDSNQSFYAVDSLHKVASKLKPQGIFAIWSNEREDPEFIQHLQTVFPQVENQLIEFANPYSGGTSFNSIYLAQR
jgi:spermidine synthase